MSEPPGGQPAPADRDREIETLRARLEQAEEALRALAAGELDSVDSADESGPLLLHEAQAALRASEERFRALVQNSSDIIVVLAEDGEVDYASPAFERVLGHPSGEDVGLRLRDLLHPDDVPAFDAAVESLQRGDRQRVDLDLRARHRQDGHRHLQCIFQDLTEVRGIGGLVLNARDVSAELRARRALSESERMFEAVVEASPLPVMLFQLDGEVLVYNEAAERLFGWAKQDLTGLVDELIPERLSEDGAELRRRVVEDGEAVSGHVASCVRKDGTEILASISAAPVRDAEGEIAGVVAIMEDITARRELEEQLRRAQRMEAIGQLAGGIAHDFNNLLTAIGGYADLAIDGLADDHPAQADIEEICAAADRAAALTQQLLAFSRQQVRRVEAVDLNGLIGGLEGMLGRLIGEDIELVTGLEPELWTIDGDPGQLEQVITNLVVNARDAMPEGGRLSIETENLQVDEAQEVDSGEFTLLPGGYVLLRVGDTGIGMDADTRARIFEPFFTTKERDKGTGLGLATVYGVVKQSDGYITVASEPGSGATFEIFLPRGTEPLEPVRKGAGPERQHRGNETVLLVEDEPGVRTFAARALEARGYTVWTAESAERALELFGERVDDVDLLVTDVVMPGLRGPELAERLWKRAPDLQVLYISGYMEREYLERKGLGSRAPLLEKPFGPQALAQRVREVLDGRREKRRRPPGGS